MCAWVFRSPPPRGHLDLILTSNEHHLYGANHGPHCSSPSLRNLLVAVSMPAHFPVPLQFSILRRFPGRHEVDEVSTVRSFFYAFLSALATWPSGVPQHT